MTSDLALSDPRNDRTWREIVEEITAQLNDGDEIIPNKVIKATEHLLCGWSIPDTARAIGVHPDTIRRWLSKYPRMAVLLAEHRTALQAWRMAQLDQQFLLAIHRSREILESDLSGETIDPKAAGIIAQQARFIIDKVLGNKSQLDINIKSEERLIMRATEDALDYIAKQLQTGRNEEEPIEVTYRVIDPKFDRGPWLREDGQPRHGKLGTIDVNQRGAMCHICGTRVRFLHSHVLKAHNLSDGEYELAFLLDDGAVRRSEPKSANA